MSTRHLFSTESLVLSTTESQKAWHLLALLISLGRPSPPAQLASRCTLFPASIGTIQSLCSIPNSPISLLNNGLITASFIGHFAFAHYFSTSNLIDGFLPRNFRIRDVFSTCFKKRKRIVFDNEIGDDVEQELPKRMRNACSKVHYYVSDNSIRSVNSYPSNISVTRPCLLLKASAGELSCKDTENVEGEMQMNVFVPKKVLEESIASEPDSESGLLSRVLDYQIGVGSSVHNDASHCPEDNISSLVEVGNVGDACKAMDFRVVENEEVVEGRELEQLIELGSSKGGTENLFLPFSTAILDVPPDSEFNRINRVYCNDKMPLLDNDPTTTHMDAMAVVPATEPSVAEQLPKPSAKMTHRDAVARELPAISKSLGNSKTVNTPKEKQQCRRGQTLISKAQKSKQTHNEMHIKEKKRNSNSISSEDQLKPKELPNFESYIVEEEEGSGGYGTVYRARRKSDGSTVAIKCPHANAHRHHVNNELRMLERFGGKNFVIKYEGCFKNGNFDCFVLEHVEHDRPEVLKKEIDIFQLQWYGYCMFRALASLHKQGIVHRDVKPGNFLFSRKANKGYLIDFNLAMDLHQKYGVITKSKVGYDMSFNHVTLPNPKSLPPTNIRKFPSAKALDAVNQGAAKGSKSAVELKKLKKRAVDQTKAYNDLGNWNKINSQGADGSGITSAKDVTSTRTPSAERLREPLPCQGRKELINLLQKAMHSPNHEALRIPAPMRKRVAAPPGKVDRELLYLTPMPLHSTGIAVAGAGLIKNKGDGKHKREGPCAGTKGFRAPEVLFRSPHQGPKADIWSAGVTLLYLMIGRTPFFGDPEQNIKDIAKLRGSEDLWEVAKLHNRESSFPEDLYGTQCLPSMNLRDWCQVNTKRRDFLDIIPSSLFDLVDKCMTVNPRLRISAEDALKHEFFAPCHEGLRKQRLLRQGLSLDSAGGRSSHGISIARTAKIS